jgi:PAS domain S-box-containing protein
LPIFSEIIGNQEIKILKDKLNLIILSIILGAGIIIIDIFVDSYIFSNESLSEAFIMHTSGPSLYVHLILLIALFFIVLFSLKIIADHRKEKETLQEYLILLETANDAIFIADCDTGIILNANRKAEEMIGIPLEMIKGMHQSELHPSEEVDRYRNIFNEYIRENSKHILMNLLVLHKSGRKIPVDISANVIEIGKKRIIQGIFRDARERIKSEEALQQSNYLISKFMEETNDVFFVKDIEGHYTMMNSFGAQLLGKAKENIIGKSDMELFPPDTAQTLIDNDLSVIKSETTKTKEEKFQFNGNKHVYLTTKVPLYDNKGKISGIIGIARDITERKRIEEALRKSELKYRELLAQSIQDWKDTFETIPDMITIHDKDFNLIHANKAAKEILNLPILDPQTINKCFKYYHGTGAPPEGCPSCDCYNTGKPATFEVFEPHLNRFIEIRAIPRFDKEHKLVGLIHVVRDITERKKMEEKLLASEKRFHAAATSTADLIWERDTRSGSLNWFGDIDTILGYEAGEFPRTIKGFEESVHPGDLNNFNKAVQKSLKSGRKLSVEYRMKCKESMYRYWHETGKAIEFENNKPVKWVGSVTDITGRKIAEENLIANEEKYKKLSLEFHTLLDAIPDKLILLSPDLKVLWSNTAFDSHAGKKASACQGKHCYKLCCNISSPCNNCPVIKCFQSGNEEATQVTDTEGRILDKRAFPIFEDSGKVSKVIEVSRDITAKIRMEEEAKLVQSRLIHANKMTSLGALVSGVAHEINNPNSYIMSNTQVFSKIWKDAVEILKENCHDKRDVLIGGVPFPRLLELAPKMLNGINDGSVRIRNIVDSLRNFSQPKRTDMDGKVYVNKVIMSSRSILDHNIKQFTHNFHVNCNDNIPPARGNTQQIEQVIINLIMNALHSLPDMTSGIWLTTSHNEKSNTIEIKVRDRGVGMSDDVLQQVTEPFFTTRADTGGTGLGLSISYAIIKDHEGSLSFKSEKGKGTTVTITLPAYNRKDMRE